MIMSIAITNDSFPWRTANQIKNMAISKKAMTWKYG
jgi:hypothetical protein